MAKKKKKPSRKKKKPTPAAAEPTPLTVPQLLDGCFRGDPQAVLEFYNRYHKLLRKAIRRWFINRASRTGDRVEDVKDILHDILAHIMWNDFARLRHLRDASRLPGFLATTARNVIRTSFRKDLRRPRMNDLSPDGLNYYDGNANEPENPIDLVPDPVDTANAMHERFSAEKRRAIMKQAMTRLRPWDRRILDLYCTEEKSYVEIAEIMGLTLTNVGVKISRAKALLTRIIASIIRGLGGEEGMLL
ncbi:MAG: sigma-70 family RNA polymerase sigma factor [Candidatus Omnitrophota bacterium]